MGVDAGEVEEGVGVCLNEGGWGVGCDCVTISCASHGVADAVEQRTEHWPISWESVSHLVLCMYVA